MQRRYELIDVVVAIGLFATIAASGLFFMTANGMVSVSLSGQEVREHPTGKGDGMQWLEPVLGQAIVDQSLLERHNTKVMLAAVTELNGVTGEHMRWQNSPFGYLDSIKTSAARAETDHAARVQAVMGQSIVNFTRRGVRSDVLSSEGDILDFNTRMIDRTDALGQRMNAEFLANWQPNLGRAIVVASQDSAKVSALRQERLGAAIAQLTIVQTIYEAFRATIQEQLGGATLAAIQTESQAVLSGQGRPIQFPAVTVAALQSWPDLPMSTIVVASLILMSLFSAGLLVSSRLPGVHVDELVQIGPVTLVYSKTV